MLTYDSPPPMTIRENLLQYTSGFFGINVTAVFAGISFIEALPLATILPALVILFVNLPRFLREAIALYREYKNPQNKPE